MTFDVADAARYSLEHRGEIVALLERLRADRVLMTMEYADGHAVVSRILEVRRDANVLVVDVARDAALNAELFAAERLTFTGELDHVQIGFDTTRAAPVAMADGPAAAVDLPLSVVRLQRREWFRVRLDDARVLCTVIDERGEAMPAHAVDLSCGGIGVVVELGRATIGAGHELILSLPDAGRFMVDATISSILPSADSTPGAPVRVRLGYRFHQLPARTEADIQRYVTRAQVEDRQR